MDMAMGTAMATDTAMAMMSVEGRMRRNAALIKSGLLFLVAGMSLPLVVMAGDWRLTDSVSADLTYVDRTGQNSSSGLVLQVSPGLRLSGKGARSEADINYRLTTSVGTGSIDPKNLSHSLRARGRVEVVDNAFFIGANASARLVGNSATSGIVDSINVNTDGSQSYSMEITPEFRHHLNRYADIVSNNRLNYVTYGGDNSNSNDSSRSVQTNVGVRSGRIFGPLNWSLDATQRRTSYDDRDDKNSTYDLGLGYRINGQVRVRGVLGYEKNDVQTLRTDTDGNTWKLGFDWTPTQRTSISADYGRRYLGNVFSGAINHRTRRTRLSLDFSRDISNRRSAQLIDSFFFLIDSTTGLPIVDPATGDPILVNIPDLQQFDEDFLNTQVRAAIAVTGRRSSASLTVNASNRQYEISDIDEDSRGLTLSLTRQLGDGYNGSVRSSLRRAEGTAGGSSDTFDVQLSLGKKLSPRTSASLEILHRNYDGSSSNSDYTENRIGISLRSSFL